MLSIVWRTREARHTCRHHGTPIGRTPFQTERPLNGTPETTPPARQRGFLAFRFAGTFPDVLTVLSGMTYMEHLQDNLRTFSPLDPCTEEEMALLEDTAQ